jgi:hypothetical protein
VRHGHNLYLSCGCGQRTFGHKNEPLPPAPARAAHLSESAKPPWPVCLCRAPVRPHRRARPLSAALSAGRGPGRAPVGVPGSQANLVCKRKRKPSKPKTSVPRMASSASHPPCAHRSTLRRCPTLGVSTCLETCVRGCVSHPTRPRSCPGKENSPHHLLLLRWPPPALLLRFMRSGDDPGDGDGEPDVAWILTLSSARPLMRLSLRKRDGNIRFPCGSHTQGPYLGDVPTRAADGPAAARPRSCGDPQDARPSCRTTDAAVAARAHAWNGKSNAQFHIGGESAKVVPPLPTSDLRSQTPRRPRRAVCAVVACVAGRPDEGNESRRLLLCQVAARTLLLGKEKSVGARRAHL